jgi:peptide/nickel transport system substrate-binding protein
MANQLLDQAGFTKGSDGIRMANGHAMAYDVLIQPTQDTEFRVIQTDLGAIGVKLIAKALDSKAEFAAISANKYADYNLALASGSAGGYDPDFGLSSFACFALGLFNRSGHCNPAYDKLYMQQSTGTPAQRQPLVYQMQQLLFDARVPIVLTYPDHIDAWSKNWTGFGQTPEGIYSFVPADTLTGVHRTG